MKKLDLYIKMDKEEYKLEISLNMTNNKFYNEVEILECIQDMLRFYFSNDTTYLYKYIKQDYILDHNID